MPPSSFLDRLFQLDGRVAIVTGACGRLGRQYVRALTGAGAAVAAFDVATVPMADASAANRVTVHRVDVTDRAQVDRAMDEVVGQLGAPTILVNNAGLGSSPADAALETGPFETYPEGAWQAMIDSHLKSTLVASQSFLAAFKRARGVRPELSGSIINISSTYGVVSPDQRLYDFRRRNGSDYFKPVGYSVAKSGVLNFTRWLAEYCAPFGVRVNTLVPGGVQEPEHDPEFVAEYVNRTPLGRMATEEDYNGAVVFLASNASAYMTGAMLVVDGGWTAR
jgi:NAD(P)-dependent dehydrogenase (short-subunit alcohol dehydrogenase family)